jgi:hypothetical protein
MATDRWQHGHFIQPTIDRWQHDLLINETDRRIFTYFTRPLIDDKMISSHHHIATDRWHHRRASSHHTRLSIRWYCRLDLPPTAQTSNKFHKNPFSRSRVKKQRVIAGDEVITCDNAIFLDDVIVEDHGYWRHYGG